jgi:hypothetical protein
MRQDVANYLPGIGKSGAGLGIENENVAFLGRRRQKTQPKICSFPSWSQGKGQCVTVFTFYQKRALCKI